jgi:hypothetical protein
MHTDQRAMLHYNFSDKRCIVQSDILLMECLITGFQCTAVSYLLGVSVHLLEHTVSNLINYMHNCNIYSYWPLQQNQLVLSNVGEYTDCSVCENMLKFCASYTIKLNLNQADIAIIN